MQKDKIKVYDRNSCEHNYVLVHRWADASKSKKYLVLGSFVCTKCLDVQIKTIRNSKTSI